MHGVKKDCTKARKGCIDGDAKYLRFGVGEFYRCWCWCEFNGNSQQIVHPKKTRVNILNKAVFQRCTKLISHNSHPTFARFSTLDLP